MTANQPAAPQTVEVLKKRCRVVCGRIEAIDVWLQARFLEFHGRDAMAVEYSDGRREVVRLENLRWR